MNTEVNKTNFDFSSSSNTSSTTSKINTENTKASELIKARIPHIQAGMISKAFLTNIPPGGV